MDRRGPGRVLAAALCLAVPQMASGSGALFVDATAATGLDFVHFNGMSGQLYMPLK